MFGTDPRDLARTLGEMDRYAREKSNFSKPEAKEKMRKYLSRDARFNGFDYDRLIDRVMESRSCGRVLDLDDPWLKIGGQKRPLSW